MQTIFAAVAGLAHAPKIAGHNEAIAIKKDCGNEGVLSRPHRTFRSEKKEKLK